MTKPAANDSINNEMLKLSSPIILLFLTILFTKILETKEFPDLPSIRITTPILKSGEAASPDN